MMDLTIRTYTKKVFEGAVTKVAVPGSLAPFQVLQNHAPIVSTLGPGTITYSDDGNKVYKFVISKGIVEVLNNHVAILCNE